MSPEVSQGQTALGNKSLDVTVPLPMCGTRSHCFLPCFCRQNRPVTRAPAPNVLRAYVILASGPVQKRASPKVEWVPP